VHDDVGDLQAPTGPEHAEGLAEDGVLVGGEVDDAVGDDEIGARVVDRQRLGQPLTCVRPVSATFSRPRSSMASVMSTAMTRPSGPTARAARNVSMPLPAPMSTTVSPARGRPSDSGLPTPAKGAVTPSGSSASSAAA
jgi:hypothetical protein